MADDQDIREIIRDMSEKAAYGDVENYRNNLDETSRGGGILDIRGGVMDNMAVVLEPAFRDLSNPALEKSIYQVIF